MVHYENTRRKERGGRPEVPRLRMVKPPLCTPGSKARRTCAKRPWRRATEARSLWGGYPQKSAKLDGEVSPRGTSPPSTKVPELRSSVKGDKTALPIESLTAERFADLRSAPQRYVVQPLFSPT